MALSLFPSWLFLAWHRGYLRSRFAPHLRLILPVLAAIAALCYLFFPYKMPLWTPESEGRYALFSWPHLMALH